MSLRINIIVGSGITLLFSCLSCDRQSCLFSPQPNYIWMWSGECETEIGEPLNHINGYYNEDNNMINIGMLWEGKGQLSGRKDVIFVQIRNNNSFSAINLEKGIMFLLWQDQTIKFPCLLLSENLLLERIDGGKFCITYEGQVKRIGSNEGIDYLKLKVELRKNEKKVDEIRKIANTYFDKHIN